MNSTSIGIVVIGRNEGERLKRCLASLPRECPTVYVDSGSGDGSVAFAHSIGVSVVDLDTSRGFTAARARNAGWRLLLEFSRDLQFIQFIDGDCEIDKDWLSRGIEAISADTAMAAVFGRRRERFPDRSIYNRMCDEEWDVPIGRALHCGGDALFRVRALLDADGYAEDLIAGEEPDLCLRLGRGGWWVQRIDAEMTLHDANILSFLAWWKRARRSGFAYAEHVWRHRTDAFPQWRRQVMSILFWGLALPAGGLSLAIVVLFCNPATFFLAPTLLALAFGLQGSRIALHKVRQNLTPADAIRLAVLLLVGKFAEMRGMVDFVLSHLRLRKRELIEYK